MTWTISFPRVRGSVAKSLHEPVHASEYFLDLAGYRAQITRTIDGEYGEDVVGIEHQVGEAVEHLLPDRQTCKPDGGIARVARFPINLRHMFLYGRGANQEDKRRL